MKVMTMRSRSNHPKLNELYTRLDDYHFQNFEQIKDDAEELLKQAYQINDTYSQAYAFLHLAIYYMMFRRFDSAEFNLKKAMGIASKDDYTDLVAQCYRNEGKLYQLKGDNFNATHAYDNALAIAESENDNATIGILYNNIAYILMQLKDYSFAKDYFEKAIIKLKTDKNQAINLFNVYINLIKVCCDMDDIENAQKYCEKAKNIKVEGIFLEFIMLASNIRIYAIEKQRTQIKESISSVLHILAEYKGNKNIFSTELLYIAESLLLADMKEECRHILDKIDTELNEDDIELNLLYQKLLVAFQEKYNEQDYKTSARYYYLLMAHEKQENMSIAESLRNRIRLFEVNQKHSLLLEEKENLEKQAHLDEITGLYNRRYCDKLLSKISSDSSVKSFGSIMIDIDHFKEYNDTYGHLQGDKILRLVADVLVLHRTKGISVGRYGGDEFYCLCTNLTDAEISSYLTNVLVDLRSRKIEHVKNDGNIVTITAGFYNDKKFSITLEDVMNHADQALYLAKENGRNNFLNYKDK